MVDLAEINSQVCALVTSHTHTKHHLSASNAPHRIRRLAFAAALTAVWLLGSLACSDSGDSGGKANGGTLVISVGGDPESLLPVLASTVPSLIITDLVYDRLAEIGDSLNTAGDQGFKPRLAKSWTWSPDSLAIAFHLDSAARWHDGQPVTAEDVRFTWSVYTDSTSGSPYGSALAGIDSVVAADKGTAVFWFKERSPLQFYDAVSTMSILPEHLLRNSRGAAQRRQRRARCGPRRVRHHADHLGSGRNQSRPGCPGYLAPMGL